MSAHVVVLDSTARRATIKTTPGKYLTDVLQEACVKLGVDASQYGLKYKGKQVDLSLAFRLSGLISGAKLELVQLSRSPSVVTVALQLPESEARGAPNGRLMDKFPSTTSLWFILRKFEAGVAGNASIRNLTARGAPVTGNGENGSGRLFYETPVIQILEREMSTFTDLQKSLAQLGFNSGNVLLRLSFRRTEDPLEVAMSKIQEYFKTSDDDTVPQSQEPSTPAEQKQTVDGPSQQEREPLESTPDASPPAPVLPEEPQNQTPPSVLSAPAEPSEPATTAASRQVAVFAPPSSDTPQSAKTAYNESDYVPSVDHAQAHQRRLNAASQNKRLLSDAEIAAKAAAEEEKLAAVKEVDVKIRLPDQSQIVAKFGQQDTGRSLYSFVRNCLAGPFAGEKFIITTFPSGGQSGKKLHNVVPDSDQTLLIKDLGMVGRVLVNFSWDAAASQAARQSRRDLLKPELRTQAKELKVEEPANVMDTSEDTVQPKSGSDRQGEKSSGRKPGSLPKWLKLPGKK
ncbi:GLUT4 regulating protein TUG-domain-containing protein [Aspergillus pseudonomiae]|uniref:GLUT4 regulating protein TUG-domain-containing protein n=1 Tax=Aspergillus pseudonomiae TaxID=1506151 RepID=A0A5N6HQ55_9EURO|nr:GLUT4 regulating protein TUG-domain-containing protein [Aspergillus pseudonomiae]KAB8254883.1 GLUT4 regulating protein TUG-domain-containing protein [Aspergillus pseudonomiae]KAE8404170.1 GLUT4 regulating protein TUG-domain-containing protein [Aspergillus pseudonomiae]